MESILIVILILCLLVPLIVHEGIIFSVRLEKIIENYKTYRISVFNSKTLIINEELYIHKGFFIYGKYRISGYGIVPYWTNLNNKIEDIYFKILEE